MRRHKTARQKTAALQDRRPLRSKTRAEPLDRAWLLLGNANIEHRTSNIEHRTSNIEHRTSNIEHRTSNIEHRTSNIERRTSNVEQKRERQRLLSVSCASSVRRSMFNVQCSMFAFSSLPSSVFSSSVF